MTLLKIILVFILLYYLFKLLLRYVFPYFVKRHLKRAQQNYTGRQNQQTRRKSGEVNIDFKPDDTKHKQDDIGEYIDYEEIKE